MSSDFLHSNHPVFPRYYISRVLFPVLVTCSLYWGSYIPKVPKFLGNALYLWRISSEPYVPRMCCCQGSAFPKRYIFLRQCSPGPKEVLRTQHVQGALTYLIYHISGFHVSYIFIELCIFSGHYAYMALFVLKPCVPKVLYFQNLMSTPVCSQILTYCQSIICETVFRTFVGKEFNSFKQDPENTDSHRLLHMISNISISTK